MLPVISISMISKHELNTSESLHLKLKHETVDGVVFEVYIMGYKSSIHLKCYK